MRFCRPAGRPNNARRVLLGSGLVLVLMLPASAFGQSVKNPVVMAARAALERQSRNLVESAQEMPDDKYQFKPTPQLRSFGALMAHVARSNEFLCSKLAGLAMKPPQANENDAKEKLVGALQTSFATCTKDVSELTDGALGQRVTLFGRPADKATALLALTNDLADHYAAAAMYLRLSGLLPPTAKGKQE